jgi:hypothetical protein
MIFIFRIHLSVLSPFFLVNTSSLFVLIIPTKLISQDPQAEHQNVTICTVLQPHQQKHETARSNPRTMIPSGNQTLFAGKSTIYRLFSMEKTVHVHGFFLHLSFGIPYLCFMA